MLRRRTLTCNLRGWACATLIVLLPCGALAAETRLFVDDVELAKKENVVRRAHACAKPAEPVLVPEKPWEQEGEDRRIYVYGTVVRDPATGQFRMWYNRLDRILYATSEDGLMWRRPELGLVEHEGSAENNLLPIDMHSPSVVFDPDTENADARYKMLGHPRKAPRGYCVAHSADGLKWTFYPKNPLAPGGDTCTLAHDADTGEFFVFFKKSHEHRGHRRRLVYLSTSRNMHTWTEPVLVMAPDEIDDAQTAAQGGKFSQFYNMSAFRRGNQWLGLVTHFRYSGSPPRKGPRQSGDDGPIDVQLVHSRDGLAWKRCEDRSPVIPNGPHDYDAGCILGTANSPVFVDDEMWIFYTAITTTHGGFVPEKVITIALAKWRRDGFVSLDAGEEEGVVETVPLEPAGKALCINADAEGGRLLVELLHPRTGEPLDGYSAADAIPITTDSVAHEVRWKNGSALPSDVFQIRFRLKNTRLYSYAL